MVRTTDLDIVFLTYDEPCREAFWRDLQGKYPPARRVQGTKGLDGGFKAAVAAGDTDHVITIDGDCLVDPAFFDLLIDEDLLRPNTRLDWPSRNVVNGVVSGNGGIKCWPKAMAAAMRSHESADPAERSIDFPRAASLDGAGPQRVEATTPMAAVHCNGSPLQAFRSAFREAIRLWRVGEDAEREGMPADRLHPLQRHRLLLWCSVGADAENGLWCLYGARLASRMIQQSDWDVLLINDFDWFDAFWRDEITARFSGNEVICERTGYAWDRGPLLEEIGALGPLLREQLGLEVAELSPDQSRFCKRLYEPALNLNALDGLGTMFRRGLGVARNHDKARRCYETAARVGHPGALYDLARLELADASGPARQRGIGLLREASVLGNSHAARHLSRLGKADPAIGAANERQG
jgi:hypothetical protein